LFQQYTSYSGIQEGPSLTLLSPLKPITYALYIPFTWVQETALKANDLAGAQTYILGEGRSASEP